MSKGKGPQEATSTRNICTAAVKMVSPHFFSIGDYKISRLKERWNHDFEAGLKSRGKLDGRSVPHSGLESSRLSSHPCQGHRARCVCCCWWQWLLFLHSLHSSQWLVALSFTVSGKLFQWVFQGEHKTGGLVRLVGVANSSFFSDAKD